jgi:hypothetical protein
MSSDLYEREIADRLGGFEPVNRVEPGAFDGFLRGTGLSAMHALARTGAGIDIVGALGPMAQDTITGGTEAQDRYFKEHDELYGRAMEFWTPKPDEVGIAGQITGELLTMIPMVVASPGLTVAGLQVGEALELMRRGAGWKEALGVGTVQAAGLGLGIYVPILGRTLAQRVLLGGAGFNIIQGAGTRGASELVLKDHPELAQIYGALDPAYLTMDILLGLAFGGLAHVSPAMRAQGGEALVRLEKWLQGADAGTKDALATMRQAQHLGADSLPGRPVEPKDAAFHVERVRRAIEQAARNEPVDVSDIPEPKTEPLPEIQAERAANLEQLVAAAEEVRVAEDLPAAPEEPVAPRRLVAEDLTLVPVEQQARVLGQAVENRLLELKLDEGQAKANAALWEAFFETTSRKYGVRVDALLATYGIDVRRMSRADLEQMMPEVLAQQELDRPAAKARVDELKRLIEPLARKGELTKTEADRYEGLVREMEGIRHTLAKPARAEDVASAAERKSTLSAKVSATAYNDLLGNREVFAAIREAAAGARFDRATAVDRIVSGENARVTARQLYDAFASTRQALREQYGPSLTLYRATGKQRRKPTTNWATTRAFAEQFGKDIITKQVPIDNVLAVHTTKAGKYHEVIVVDKPPERAPGETLFQSEAKSQLVQTAKKMQERWYSELERRITEANIKASAAKGWKDYLKGLMGKGQVKAEEMKWSGIEEWLDLQGGRVSKEQVLEFLKKNGVQVEETLYGGEKGEPTSDLTDPAIADDVALLRQQGFEAQIDPENASTVAFNDGETGDIVTASEIRQYAREARSEASTFPHDRAAVEKARVLEMAATIAQRIEAYWESGPTGETLQGGRRTKFGQYVLPGGENYRELLLTLPRTESPRVADLRAELEELVSLPSAVRTYKGEDRTAAFERLHAAFVAAGGTPEVPRGFQQGHFDEPNVLAHVRFNERTDAEGKRVLFIEEIQSDWAQSGKKQGFAGERPRYTIRQEVNDNAPEVWLVEDPDGRVVNFGATRQEAQAWADVHERETTKGVPTGPFVGKTEAWVGLTLKRMIRWAAENGFDKLAWTTGEQQVNRYTSALRKAVDAIEWKKTPQGVQLVGYKHELPAHVRIDPSVLNNIDRALQRNDQLGFDTLMEARMAVRDHNDWRNRWPVDTQEDEIAIQAYIDEVSRQAAKPARRKVVDTTEQEDVLSDAIGKSMADRIRDDPAQSGTIEGEGIRVDDTGMATFYDRIVPNVAKDVLKKLGGGKVAKVQMDLGVDKETAPLYRPESREMPEFDDMSDSAREAYGGAEHFRDGEPPMLGETRITIDGESVDVEVLIAPDGVHLIGERGGEAFELLMPADRFSHPSRFRQQDGALNAADEIWGDHGFWADNVELITGDVRTKGVEVEQQAIEITPELRERALSGMPLFQAPERGAIRIGPETVIGLFEKADASTFAHESAHLFLTMTRDLASRGGAPIEALQDWSTLARWLKLEGGEITRAQQEQFATGFERYLAEGKAPSEELRSVFQQFRDWLIQIYRSVAAIAEDLPDEIRGVMDRMLASERRDPTPKAKGPPPAEAEPPPPPGEAGAAGRPEARGIDQDWRARTGEPSAPARVVPSLPLADPAIVGKVDLMLAAELGWEQIGGRRARADISRNSGQPNFTEWIPKSELWPGRPAKHLNEAQVRRAVEKARAGERLGTAEQATVDYLVRLANERMADIEAIGGPEEWNATAREAADAGLEPSTQTIQDVDAIARASQADELAVERAAQKYENDEPAFMAEIRRILGKEKPRAAEAPGERAPEGGAEARGEQAGRRGEPQEPDPLREAALRVVEADPERLIPIGIDADGNPTYQTLRQYLDDELLDAADAREDANLVRAAAQCLYGKG